MDVGDFFPFGFAQGEHFPIKRRNLNGISDNGNVPWFLPAVAKNV